MNMLDGVPDIETKLRYLESVLAPSSRQEPVHRIETHLSWLLIGGEQVLKLKKPLRTDVVDLTTVEARERNAREEVRINRRLARHVYRGLLALQWHDGALSLWPETHLPAPGTTVDWLVAMQRLPEERMLDRVIAAGALTAADVDALWSVLEPFYRHAPHAQLDEDAVVARWRRELEATREVLEMPRFALAGVGIVIGRMDHALHAMDPIVRARVREGRYVEAHGDLRPEHVGLVDPPVIIDGLEFDARLRELDPFDELCFLGMECAMLGEQQIGEELVLRCAQALDDAPPPALLAMYTAHRALLRARLSAAHLLDADIRLPRKWLPQAQRYIMRATQALDTLERLA